LVAFIVHYYVFILGIRGEKMTYWFQDIIFCFILAFIGFEDIFGPKVVRTFSCCT